jgi:hypothetical protein
VSLHPTQASGWLSLPSIGDGEARGGAALSAPDVVDDARSRRRTTQDHCSRTRIRAQPDQSCAHAGTVKRIERRQRTRVRATAYPKVPECACSSPDHRAASWSPAGDRSVRQAHDRQSDAAICLQSAAEHRLRWRSNGCCGPRPPARVRISRSVGPAGRSSRCRRSLCAPVRLLGGPPAAAPMT